MSQSLFVEYRGRGFWAFDVVVSVFLKHLVDVAEPRIAGSSWLGEIVERWRVDTLLCGQFGVELDEQWSSAQMELVVELFEATCEILGRRDEIRGEEIEGWQLLDGERGFARGMPVVRTKSVINLGNAITALLRGTLPEAPAGSWWWYGAEEQPGTLERR